MANPLSSIKSSVKLTSNPELTPSVIPTNVNGQLVDVLQIRGILTTSNPGDSPSSTTTVPNCKVIAGTNYICPNTGVAVDSLLGGTLSVLEFPDMSQVASYVEGGTITNCRLNSHTVDEILMLASEAALSRTFVLGEKLTTGANVETANSPITTINNQCYSVQVSVVSGTCSVIGGGTVTLVTGQSLYIDGANDTVSASVTNSTTFVLAGTPPADGTYTCIIGARIRASGAFNANITSYTTSVTFGGYVVMDSYATGSQTAASYDFQFYSSIRTFADVRDGDYFEMAIPMGVVLTDPPTSYAYIHGFVRAPNSATGTFVVYDAETGGSPVTAVDGSNVWFVGAVTSERPVINVYQRHNLPFPYLPGESNRIKGRLASSPTLTKGAAPMRLQPGRLVGRVVSAPALLPIDASQYIRLKPSIIRARMLSAPALDRIESDILLKRSYIKGRMPTKNLSGGYLRVAASVRAKVRSDSGEATRSVSRAYDITNGSPYLFEALNVAPIALPGSTLSPVASCWPLGESVMSVQTQTVKANAYIDGTGAVMVAPSQSGAGIVVGAKVSATYISPGAEIVTVSYVEGLTTGAVVSADEIEIPDTVLVMADQLIEVAGESRYVAAITPTSPTQIVELSSAIVATGTVAVKLGSLFSVTSVTGPGSADVTVGAHTRMATPASAGATAHTCVFTSVIRAPLRLASNASDINRFATGRITSRVPTAILTGHEFLRRASVIRGMVNGRATFVMMGRGLSVREAVADILGVWNLAYNSRCCLADDVKERAVSDLNAALQIIYSRARHLDYFNRKTLTIEVDDTGVATMPNTFQTVLGTCRYRESDAAGAPSKVLSPCRSLEEAMTFSDIYNAGSAPIAYFIDRRAQAEANATLSKIMVMPKPTTGQTIYVDIDASESAPRYTWRDVELATPLHIPATYAESLLFPISRQRATTFRLFSDQARKQTIEQHYRKAMQALGLVDSAPKQVEKPQTADVDGRE